MRIERGHVVAAKHLAEARWAMVIDVLSMAGCGRVRIERGASTSGEILDGQNHIREGYTINEAV